MIVFRQKDPDWKDLRVGDTLTIGAVDWDIKSCRSALVERVYKLKRKETDTLKPPDPFQETDLSYALFLATRCSQCMVLTRYCKEDAHKELLKRRPTHW